VHEQRDSAANELTPASQEGPAGTREKTEIKEERREGRKKETNKEKTKK
jgi:hypothetical protein